MKIRQPRPVENCVDPFSFVVAKGGDNYGFFLVARDRLLHAEA